MSSLPVLSAALERGFALFDERADAFGEIGFGGALRESLGFALELRFERIIERALQERLGAAIDSRGAVREARRELRGFGLELCCRHHLVDDAETLGGGR